MNMPIALDENKSPYKNRKLWMRNVGASSSKENIFYKKSKNLNDYLYSEQQCSKSSVKHYFAVSNKIPMRNPDGTEPSTLVNRRSRSETRIGLKGNRYPVPKPRF